MLEDRERHGEIGIKIEEEEDIKEEGEHEGEGEKEMQTVLKGGEGRQGDVNRRQKKK